MRSKLLSLLAVLVAPIVAVPGLVQAQQPIRLDRPHREGRRAGQLRS
jgi:hypothetical protein